MCILLLFENVFIEYVLAPDSERAAWQALELSDQIVKHGHSDCAQYIIANVKEATQLYTNGYQEWY